MRDCFGVKATAPMGAALRRSTLRRCDAGLPFARTAQRICAVIDQRQEEWGDMTEGRLNGIPDRIGTGPLFLSMIGRCSVAKCSEESDYNG